MPRGLAHYRFKGAGYAKDLPAALAADYTRALSDDDLHKLNHELALLKARLSELVRRLSAGESRGFIVVLNEAADGLEAAAKEGDAAGLQVALAAVVRLIRNARDYEGTWSDLMGTIEAAAKIATLEHKRRRDEKLLLPVENAGMMMTAIANSVRKHVKDEKALRAIAMDFSRIMGRTEGRAGVVRADEVVVVASELPQDRQPEERQGEPTKAKARQKPTKQQSIIEVESTSKNAARDTESDA